MDVGPRCHVCGIPLDAVISHTDGVCDDAEACIARRDIIAERGGATLLTPDGAVRIEPGPSASDPPVLH